MNAVCDRLLPNLDFAENVLKKSNIQHKYLRIRYEDFVLNPIGKTLKIYDFIGINMTMNVKEWLDNAMSVQNENNRAQPQSLKRNSKTVLNSWRKTLSFEAVELIQRKCEDVFKILGYAWFKNETELKDFSKPFFNPNWN